jgi:hypothetical protein
MFSKEAQKALTTETRGQNSRVNYGEQNYAKAGKYKNLPMSQRPYAIQKVDLLPDEFTNYDSKLKMINGYQDVDLNFKDQGAFAKFRQENADYMIVSAENVM